jgi:hypothetical protein
MKPFDRQGRGLSWLVLGALVGLRGATGGAAAEEPVTLSVVVVDLAHLDGVPLKVAVAEVDSTLGPLGIRVSWDFAKPGSEIDPLPIRVVLLERRPCGRQKSENVFASVTPTNDSATIWVCVPNLIAAPAVRRPGQSGADPRRLGIGLGRVIVHELVHLADPELRHGQEGLFCSTLNRKQLVDAPGHIEPAAQESLRRASIRWAGPPRPREAESPLVGALR